MSLVSLLATTTLITMANSTPMIYPDQRAKIPVDNDHLLLILLLNRRDLYDFKTKPLNEAALEYEVAGMDSGGERPQHHSGLTRDKRIGSLSIVDSVDVLRERVLLELARRKAMEDQLQMSENRRMLNSVGKRSSPGFGPYRGYRSSRKKRLDALVH